MKIESLLEYDRSDAYEEPNWAQDPNIIQAIEQDFISVYRMFEAMSSFPEQLQPQLDRLDEIMARKGRGDSTEDYYVEKTMVPRIEKAITSGQHQRAFRWILHNARTIEEIVDSGEMNDAISDTQDAMRDEQDYRNDPYRYHGVSKGDFM